MEAEKIIIDIVDLSIPKKEISGEGYFTYDVNKKVSILFSRIKFCLKHNDTLVKNKVHNIISDAILASVKNKYRLYIQLSGGGTFHIDKDYISVKWLDEKEAESLYESTFDREDSELFCQHVQVEGQLKDQEIS